MMGWIILFMLAGLVMAALLWLGHLPRSLYEMAAAAVLLAIAGYAWQGHPGFAGAPRQNMEKQGKFDEKAISSRNELGERFGTAGRWLVISDALNRMGRHQDAANYLRKGIEENPKNSDLWVGLGNALVVHSDGVMTPAAQYAFQRAASLSPEHPAPPFFLGLAYAQSGKIEEARRIWTALLQRASADTPWRKDLESRLQMLDRMQPSLAVPDAEKDEANTAEPRQNSQ